MLHPLTKCVLGVFSGEKGILFCKNGIACGKLMAKLSPVFERRNREKKMFRFRGSFCSFRASVYVAWKPFN